MRRVTGRADICHAAGGLPGGRAASEASGQPRPRKARHQVVEQRATGRVHDRGVSGMVEQRADSRDHGPRPMDSSFVHILIRPLDSNTCSHKNGPMSAALDLHPDTGHPVTTGAAELHHLLDRMHAHSGTALASGEYAALLADLDRARHRLEALKLKVLAAADRAGTAKSAGFTGTDAWTAKHTNTSRTTAAREVHLATELEAGHGHESHRRGPRRRPGLPRPRRGHPARHRPAPHRSHHRTTPNRRGSAGRESPTVQPRPAAPPGQTSPRNHRTRPDRRRRPRERTASAPTNKPPSRSAH